MFINDNYCDIDTSDYSCFFILFSLNVEFYLFIIINENMQTFVASIGLSINRDETDIFCFANL